MVKVKVEHLIAYSARSRHSHSHHKGAQVHGAHQAAPHVPTFPAIAGTIVKAYKFPPILPIIRSLHWLKINERIEYKLFSLTYKVLRANQPDYLPNLSVQSTCCYPSSTRPYLHLPHYKSPTALFYMYLLTPVE